MGLTPTPLPKHSELMYHVLVLTEASPMTNTLKSTPPAPRFRQAAIPTCGHANNANNFSYEKNAAHIQPCSHTLRTCPTRSVRPEPVEGCPPSRPKTPLPGTPTHATLSPCPVWQWGIFFPIRLSYGSGNNGNAYSYEKTRFSYE